MSAPRRVALATGAAALAHMLPSVAVLGQWTPLRTTAGGGFVWRGTSQARIALTFDDGPDPANTPAVLDRLDALGVRATFFCLGERVAANPGLAGEMHARGHEIGTHGHRHHSHFRHTALWIADDLRRATDAMADAGLPVPQWFRPPFGHVSAGTVVCARSRRLPIVLWSAMGREWVEPTAAAVAARVRRSLSPGAVVLLHDAEINTGSSSRVVAALEPITAAIAARGWDAVPLGELLSGR